MLKLATWNVNSIGVRKERLLRFLEREQPDVVCLQELKTTDDKFPYGEVEAAGYHSAVHGQKTYNGVAILSRKPLDHVTKGFGDGGDDDHSRFISAKTAGLTVMSAYVPNGQSVGSDKYAYKLEWMKRLKAYLVRHHDPKEPLALVGDFNVAPEEIDVHDPDAWREQVLFSTKEREALKTVMSFGLDDVFRRVNPAQQAFSWWDYRMLAFPKNLGLRIDLILGTDPVWRAAKACRIDREERKGDKPSDHAPVIAELLL